MIYRLLVELVDGMYMPEKKVTRTLDVSGSCNLEKLCLDILGSIDFDFDHLYEFVFPGGKHFEGTPDLTGKSVCRNTRLYSLDLKEKTIFRLIYDYGDNWMFNIHVKQVIDKPGTDTVVVRRVGRVEQYPDYEDWDEEMDEDWEDEDDFLFGEGWDDEDDFLLDDEWGDEDFDNISFDYTAPDRLFDVAFQYKKAKLWNKLWSSEIVAVRFSDGVTGYLCIMGKDGQHCALGIYLGDKGLESFRSLSFDEPRQDPFGEQERILEQDCIQLVLDNKEYLIDSEIDAASDYARRNNIRLAGKNAYPHFVRYTPYHYPWYPMEKTEENYIYEAAKAAIFLAEQLKDKKPVELGISSFLPGTKELPCIAVSENAVSFAEPVTLPEQAPRSFASPAPANDVMVKKAKKLKQKNTVLCKIVRMPEPVMSEDGSAPFFPLVIISADEKTDKIYPLEILENYDDDPEDAINTFLKSVVNWGFVPKKIKVSDERTKSFVERLAKELSIDLSLEKELPVLDACIDELMQEMLDDYGRSPQADYEILITIAEEIANMPAEIVRTMPEELKAELRNMIGFGILPDELADKVMKKIGK